MSFGARNSVYSFTGFRKALQMLCCVLFCLPSSEYVDDFTQVALRADSKAGQWMSRVMEFLGWRVQSDPEKTRGFSTIFHAPGVVFTCAKVACGASHVEDRPGRVESVMQLFIQTKEKGILSPPMASTIKDKLQYTRSQSFGRARGPGLQAFRCYEAGLVWQALPLGDLVQFWTKHFEVRKPRRLLTGKWRPPVVGFTDGAVETVDGALFVTVGSVLFDPLSNQPPSFFAERVQEKKVQECRREHQASGISG